MKFFPADLTLKFDQWFPTALSLFVLVMPLFLFPMLPVTGAKVRMTDIVFLVMAPLGLISAGKSIIPRPDALHFSLLAYLVILSLSTLMAGKLDGYLEIIGRWYLLVLFLIVSWYCKKEGPKAMEVITKAWTLGVFIMLGSAGIGYLLGLGGVPNSWVQVYDNYPYFGTVLRSTGLSGGGTPMMMLSIFPLAYFYRSWRKGMTAGWPLLVVLPILVLALSKEFLLFLLALLLVEPYFDRRKIFRILAVVSVTLFYWGATHYIIQPRQAYEGSYLEGEISTSGNIVWRGEEWQLLETSYTAIKRASLAVANEYPLLGVGADQFPHQLPAKKQEGVYPQHLPDYSPHSAWFGNLAEAGYTGFLAILTFLFFLLRKIRKFPWKQFDDDHVLCLTVLLLMCAIGGMVMDLFHLRFLWVALGMFLGMSYWYEGKETAEDV